jgi:hypothetical protein
MLEEVQNQAHTGARNRAWDIWLKPASTVLSTFTSLYSRKLTMKFFNCKLYNVGVRLYLPTN